jgi:putative hydrolase of the HAD superfamily
MEKTATPIATIRNVFFDLDDTLCAYWEASKQALRETFEAHPVPGKTVQEMVDTWAAAFRDFSPSIKGGDWYAAYLRKGETTRIEQMRLMLVRLGNVDDEFAKELSDVYGAKRDQHLTLFDEAPTVLDALYGRFPLGLITNGPADVQRQEIETLGIGRYFEHVYIEGEMGRGKPLPEVFDQIASDVKCKPEEILFVGNSYHHDIRPAIRAGWHTVWVRKDTDVAPSASGAHLEHKPPNEPDPDLTVGDLREMLPLLGL